MQYTAPTQGSASDDLRRIRSGDTFTRKEAGMMLHPPLEARQVQRYLRFLAIWHPDFARFKDPDTWGLNREPITRRDLIELQALRQLFLQLKSQSRIQLEYRRMYHGNNS
jgi:hypothetical protein